MKDDPESGVNRPIMKLGVFAFKDSLFFGCRFKEALSLFRKGSGTPLDNETRQRSEDFRLGTEPGKRVQSLFVKFARLLFGTRQP